MSSQKAPILSTPAENILEAPGPVTEIPQASRLSEEQLYVQYEIKRTVDEIRAGKWKRIALQFPDDMLVDAPRVFERLRDDLKAARKIQKQDGSVANITEEIDSLPLQDEADDKLCILADTSYGACCVDEVAAEHVDAEVVVHYGRSCLSPTARLPVIYIFTSRALDISMAVASFQKTYTDLNEKVCLMADIPYHHHVPTLSQALQERGYQNLYPTEIIRDPSSPLPNRSLPPDVASKPDLLKDYSVFHISTPPTSLLLVLSSRIKSIHIFPVDTPTSTSTSTSAPLLASTTALLRRRYALLTRLTTVPIFGILINTLSVANYMTALAHCQRLIARAGKKSYVFVVGKVNAAKLANFAEVGGWVVIGCWESSLLESGEFYRPVITPFELEVALTRDRERVWGGEWVADFGELLRKGDVGKTTLEGEEEEGGGGEGGGEGEVGLGDKEKEEVRRKESRNWDEMESDDEPPEFDLRTGRYVSQSRPMRRQIVKETTARADGEESIVPVGPAPPSSALVQKARGDLVSINGQVSPAAEFLRSKRTWQGLGSDYEIEYERDEEGRIRGAAMEEGRTGVAKGYTVGEEANKH